MATAALILTTSASSPHSHTHLTMTAHRRHRSANPTPPFTALWWEPSQLTSALVLGLLAPAGMLELAAVRPPTAKNRRTRHHAPRTHPRPHLPAAMGESWRIGVDETEHTPSSPTVSSLIRNPIFTGMGVVLVGQLPPLTTAAAASWLHAAVQIQVRAIEEPYLLRTHGRPTLLRVPDASSRPSADGAPDK